MEELKESLTPPLLHISKLETDSVSIDSSTSLENVSDASQISKTIKEASISADEITNPPTSKMDLSQSSPLKSKSSIARDVKGSPGKRKKIEKKASRVRQHETADVKLSTKPNYVKETLKSGVKSVVFATQKTLTSLDSPAESGKSLQEQPMQEQLEKQKNIMKETQAEKKAFEKQFETPESLDLFAMETRARRTIGELIRPIITESDTDRRKVAEVSSKYDRIISRLNQLEYSLGLSDTKPKLFQEIDDKIADIKMIIAQNKNDGNFKIGLNEQRIGSLETDMRQCIADVKSTESLTKMSYQETKRSNQQQMEMKLELQREVSKLETQIGNLEFRLRGKLSIFEQQQEVDQSKICDFDQMVREIQNLTKSAYDQSTQNNILIGKLTERKLDQKVFDLTKIDLTKQIETIRYATYDNFRVIRSTDNYVEKYLPFQIQAIVSKNILSFIKTPLTIKQIKNGVIMNQHQQAQKLKFDSFKEAEYNVYKSFHRNILNDDGIPHIKKTTFRMPGYRQILSEQDEDDYVIENDRIYDRVYEAHRRKKQGLDEISDADSVMVMQDIVPIESVNEESDGSVTATAQEQSQTTDGGKSKNKMVIQKKKQKKPTGKFKPVGIEQDSEGGPEKKFSDRELNQEQDCIESRQVVNIYKMMGEGSDIDSLKKKNAEPFLNYAMDKYGLNNASQQTEQSQQSQQQSKEVSAISDLERHNESNAIKEDEEEKEKDLFRHLINTDGGQEDISDIAVPKKSTDNLKVVQPQNQQADYRDITIKIRGVSEKMQKPRNTMKFQKSGFATMNNKNYERRMTVAQKDLQVISFSKMQQDDLKRKSTMPSEFSGIENGKVSKNRQKKMDQISLNGDLTGLTFHERRKQTNYLVGFQDLEPAVTDMINTNNVNVGKVQDQITELQKEITEHKQHVAKMTSNTDMPMLKPIKAIIDEQITAMYSFQNEIKHNLTKQNEKTSKFGLLFESLQDRVHKMHLTVVGNRMTNLTPNTAEETIDNNTMHSRAMSPKEELITKREEIMSRRKTSRPDNKSLKGGLGSSSNRSGSNRTKSGSPKRANKDEQLVPNGLEVSLQSSELVVDLMKLQNILNFEVQKILKQLQPTDQPQTPVEKTPTLRNQVLVKDNMMNQQDSPSESEHVYQPRQMSDQSNNLKVMNKHIEVNVLADQYKKQIASAVNSHAQQNVVSMSGIQENSKITTELRLKEPNMLTDVSMHQHNRGQSPMTPMLLTQENTSRLNNATAPVVGIKINKDINLFPVVQSSESQQNKNNALIQPLSINCTTVISMLDSIRQKYEKVFQGLKNQQQQFNLFGGGHKKSKRLNKDIKSTADGSHFFDFIKSEDQLTTGQMSHSNLITDMMSTGRIRSTTKNGIIISPEDPITILGDDQIAIPMKTLDFTDTHSSNQHFGGGRINNQTNTLSCRGQSAQSYSGRRHSHKRNNNMNQHHHQARTLQHQQQPRKAQANDQSKTQSVYKRINLQQNNMMSYKTSSGGNGLAIGIAGLASPINSIPTSHGNSFGKMDVHQTSQGVSTSMHSHTRASLQVQRPILTPHSTFYQSNSNLTMNGMLSPQQHKKMPTTTKNISIPNGVAAHMSKINAAFSQNEAMKKQTIQLQ